MPGYISIKNLQGRYIDYAGKRVWMSVTKMPLRDDAGELIGLVSTTRDITARKAAEEQLAALCGGAAGEKCPVGSGPGDGARTAARAAAAALSSIPQFGFPMGERAALSPILSFLLRGGR